MKLVPSLQALMGTCLVEGVVPSFAVGTDEVDDDVGFGDEASDHLVIPDAEIFDRGNRPEVAHRQEVLHVQVVATVRAHDSRSFRPETANNVAAQETVAAKHSRHDAADLPVPKDSEQWFFFSRNIG